MTPPSSAVSRVSLSSSQCAPRWWWRSRASGPPWTPSPAPARGPTPPGTHAVAVRRAGARVVAVTVERRYGARAARRSSARWRSVHAPSCVEVCLATERAAERKARRCSTQTTQTRVVQREGLRSVQHAVEHGTVYTWFIIIIPLCIIQLQWWGAIPTAPTPPRPSSRPNPPRPPRPPRPPPAAPTRCEG
jgi:hypothetical protein